MQPVRRISLIDQTAEQLRQAVRGGRWSERLPGVLRLAAECDVSTRVVRAALRQIEAEGLISGQGPGRSRGIAASARCRIAIPMHPLRVGIFFHDAVADRQLGYMVELQRALEAGGHVVFHAKKSQVELEYDLRRISRLICETPADAWVVGAGTHEVLKWFSTHPVPSIALFGRRRGLPIAGVGPNKVAAYTEVTRELIRLGHRRIVLLCRKLRRLPEPGSSERAYLKELAAHDIQVSQYNLPDWEESVEGFHALLSSLFQVTPPTALIIDEPPLVAAAQQFLAAHHFLVPEHVSLVCSDNDASFAWCKPPISHIRWAPGPVIRHVVRWAGNVSHQRVDLKQTLFPAEFVRGGTIGPAGKIRELQH
jgi:DNA-binding LacI/PurR family transcriptional regulator